MEEYRHRPIPATPFQPIIRIANRPSFKLPRLSLAAFSDQFRLLVLPRQAMDPDKPPAVSIGRRIAPWEDRGECSRGASRVEGAKAEPSPAEAVHPKHRSPVRHP